MQTKKIFLLSFPSLISLSLVFSLYNNINTEVEYSKNAIQQIEKKAKVKVEVAKAIKITKNIEKTNDKSRLKTANIIMEVFPEELHAEALKVAICESSLRSHAYNKNRDGTRDWGVFQLNDGGTLQRLGGNQSKAKDAEWNINAAYVLYQDRGWKPWVCAKKLGLLKKS